MCRCGALAERGGKCAACGNQRKPKPGAQDHRRLRGRALLTMRRRVSKQQGYRCAACGLPQVHLELDHIIALSLGGTDERRNLQGLCHDCHLSKTRSDMAALRKARRDKVEKDTPHRFPRSLTESDGHKRGRRG